MRLIRYRSSDGVFVGVLDGERIRRVDMAPLDAASDDLLAVVRNWHDQDPTGLHMAEVDLRLGDVRLLAPFPRPPHNIFCVGKNYRDHAGEFAGSGFDATGSGEVVPSQPIVFTKPASSIIGPDELIDPHPQLTSALDYEAEFAVVIGSGGRDIAREAAWKHVWG